MKDNNTNKKKVLITGTAGFIGFHLANRLIARGEEVVGLDVINDYYDINVKYDRLAYAGIEKEDIAYGQVSQSVKHPNYRFIQLGLEDRRGWSASLPKSSSTPSSTWRRRRGCATAWKTLTPMWIATS